MSEKELHIVSFDIPDPPDYGGVVDVFYRIKALADLGVKIHLHCFQYKRESSKLLEKICSTVHYYPRKRSAKYVFSKMPFIVESRRNDELLQNLISNPVPILFEGLHSTAYLAEAALKDRLKIVRAHNVEHDYYQNLAKTESKSWKKIFFKQEARKLANYEKVLKLADHILAISSKDEAYFSKKYGNTIKVNPFHPIAELSLSFYQENYAFYHGNLTVSENTEALRYLIQDVFSKIDVPLVVAGKDAARAVNKIIGKRDNLRVHNNPTDEKMNELGLRAAVHVLPTFQDTGFKIKLLYSLFTAPFVVVNSMMVSGTDLAPFCEIADTPGEMAEMITKLISAKAEKEKLNKRAAFLDAHFSNSRNAQKIKSLL